MLICMGHVHVEALSKEQTHKTSTFEDLLYVLHRLQVLDGRPSTEAHMAI